jgi:hypothetical protein
MALGARHHRIIIVLLAMAGAPILGAAAPDSTDDSIEQFLAQDDAQPAYRATRRLEAENGSRRGWLEAVTEYSPALGFRYEITAEGGSGYVRAKVLRAVLEGEREVIAKGEGARSSLTLSNYIFQADGVDSDGLVNVRLSPRRKERVLLSGVMFLRPGDGDLVRLQGRLAKSPSFWIRNVDIVRTYDRIEGAVVPVALETRAQVRLLGEGTLRMTYRYSEIDGQTVVDHR